MRLDFLATERHYADHLAPVWHALPVDARGAFLVPRRLRDHVEAKGIVPAASTDRSGVVVVASYGDQKAARSIAGRPSIVRLEHGAGQSYAGVSVGNYAGGRDCSDVGLFLCPNEYAASRWRAAYPRARVEVVGSPKIDVVPREQLEEPTVALSFHWDCNVVPETKSAFPHFKRALAALAAMQPDVRILGHAHPRAFDALTGHYRRVGIEPVCDFEEVLARADVYACDNSSTLFEFAATDRPVVVMNAPWYRRDVAHGGRFWDWADVGIQVDRPEQLADALLEAATDEPDRREARHKVVEQVFPIRDAAARAAGVLVDWLTFRAERSAA